MCSNLANLQHNVKSKCHNLTKHRVKAFAYVFDKKADGPNAIMLKQCIFVPSLAVERGIRNGLGRVQHNSQLFLFRPNIHLQIRVHTAWYRQTRVPHEQLFTWFKRIQPRNEKVERLILCVAPYPVRTVLVMKRKRRPKKQVGKGNIHSIPAQTPHTLRKSLLPLRLAGGDDSASNGKALSLDCHEDTYTFGGK